MGKVLWLVNHYAALPREAHGTRHYWLGQGLQELGWDVRIIRSGPTPRRGTRQPVVEDVGALEVTTLPGEREEATRSSRVLGWAEFTGRLLDPRSTRHLPTPDVVLGSAVHLGAAWAARNLARRHRVPFVFEVRDLWPETLIALGALRRNSPPAVGMLRMERSLARSSALIVSPLSGVGRYMAERHGMPPEKFMWISNGVQYQNYAGLQAPPATGLRLQYFGAIGTANDVSSIIDAVSVANQQLDDPVQLQIRGSGAHRDQLIRRVAGDPRTSSVVTFPKPVPSHKIPEAMAWGNAVVLVVRDLPGLYRYGISMNKLFDYLASGRWIVMGSNVADNPIADAPGISVCQPSADSLGQAIAAVARMGSHERNLIASGNSALARDRFDYRVLAHQLAVALDRALTGRDGVV